MNRECCPNKCLELTSEPAGAGSSAAHAQRYASAHGPHSPGHRYGVAVDSLNVRIHRDADLYQTAGSVSR